MFKLLNVVAVGVVIFSSGTNSIAHAAESVGKLDSVAFRPFAGSNDVRTDVRQKHLDTSAFRPTGLAPNDIRTGVSHQGLDASAFRPKGALNDIRTDVRKLDSSAFRPGGWDLNDIRTDVRKQVKW